MTPAGEPHGVFVRFLLNHQNRREAMSQTTNPAERQDDSGTSPAKQTGEDAGKVGAGRGDRDMKDDVARGSEPETRGVSGHRD